MQLAQKNETVSVHILQSKIYLAYEEIAKSEGVTRVKLGEISRMLLIYVPETQDIDIVNRLIACLSPFNKAKAIKYFSEFLPWEVETDKDDNFVRFGKKFYKSKQIANKAAKCQEFLGTNGNIWLWNNENKPAPKPKDLGAEVTKAIKSALGGTKTTEAISMKDVLAAILKGGVSNEDLLDMCTA